MDIIRRFLGRRSSGKDRKLAANPALERPLSLQLLFPTLPKLDTGALTKTLRAYHPTLREGTFEIDAVTAANGTPLGLAGWADHVIRVVGFDVPMPTEAVNQCIQPAHYKQDLKAAGRACKGHILLQYSGKNESPIEQYVALAVIAGVMAQHGALLVLNESAKTSLPAKVFLPGQSKSDQLEILRHFPLLMMYCGFVKYELEGFKGVWMRTYGCQLLCLPNLALNAPGHHAGKE